MGSPSTELSRSRISWPSAVTHTLRSPTTRAVTTPGTQLAASAKSPTMPQPRSGPMSRSNLFTTRGITNQLLPHVTPLRYEPPNSGNSSISDPHRRATSGRPTTLLVRRGFKLLLHDSRFGLARGQEWIGPSQSELSRERLDPPKPVEAEEPDIVAETVPREGIPNRHVVVEVLRLDLAIGEGSGLVL